MLKFTAYNNVLGVYLIEVREATEDDNQALLQLQKKCPMGTSVVLSADSSPDYFGRSRPYEDWKVFVAIQDDKIVGSAGYATRNSLINNEDCRVAYEYGFIVDPVYRRKGIAAQLQNVIEKDAVRKKVDLLHLLIVEDNKPSMNFFSKMGFTRIKDIVVMALMVYKREKLLRESSIQTMEESNYEEVASLFNSTYQNYDFFVPYDQRRLRRYFEKMVGFNLENIYILSEGKDAKACLGYWDYDKVMRTTVERLNLRLRMLTFTTRFLGFFVAMPTIPKPGETLRQYYLTPAAAKDTHSLTELIKHVNNIALENHVNFITIALDPQGSKDIQAFSRFRHTKLKMHFFTKPLITQRDFSTMAERRLYIDAIDI